ncbi:hypothetical protein F511_43425 [Dorcoceras hygrometricum]|uniref:Uncharacterized protein n=1 Tax=Dorcoceras hygrometricum TaxID=472368 RepID=A0A2Z6ZZC0_9LAMI|nr:hypothetical protein F511_43425 [Dorcoceras hygrometricum]
MQYFKRAMHEGYQESSVSKAQRLSCAIKYSIINHNPNHSDSVGYRDPATTLDSQHGDSAGKSRLSDYQVSKKQAQYAMRVSNTATNPTITEQQQLAYIDCPTSSPRNSTTATPSHTCGTDYVQQLAHPNHTASTDYTQPTSKLMSLNDVASSPAQDNQLTRTSELFHPITSYARDSRTDHALDSLHAQEDDKRAPLVGCGRLRLRFGSTRLSIHLLPSLGPPPALREPNPSPMNRP